MIYPRGLIQEAPLAFEQEWFRVTFMTPHAFRLLTLLTLLLTLVLIGVGGATRVYDAGMSCPDWPACYGLWWPWPEARVMAFTHPEGYVVNGQHFAWWQVLLEWGHRGLAAFVGLGLAGLLLACWGQVKKVRFMALLCGALLASQIFLGGITVGFNNIHWSVILHLGNAMLFASALFALWWVQRVPNPAKRLAFKPLVWAVALVMPALVFVTMLVGAAVSTTHSGGVCGGLFSCAGVWMPSPKIDIGQHIHMQHRVFALLTFALSVVVMVVTKRLQPNPAVRDAGKQIHFMALGQVGLGILTLYSFASFPELYFPLSIMHLVWGTLFLLAALALPLSMLSAPADKEPVAPKRKKK